MRFAFLAVLMLAASPAARSQVMDIEEVFMEVAVTRIDHTLVALPYCLSIEVRGTNIASISVQTPSGATHALVNAGFGEWNVSSSAAASLGAIAADPQVGFGNFAFTFTGTNAAVETATVAYDPGVTDPHSGYANITFPLNGQVAVSVCPVLSWTCANGPCGGFGWAMEVYPSFGAGAEFETIVNPAATKWIPGSLTAATQHTFFTSAVTILGGAPQVPSTTPSGDLFLYVATFETTNEIDFTTQSNGAFIYCSAKSTLACGPPAICATGTPSATAASGFTISAQPARSCRSGILLYNLGFPPPGPYPPFGGPGNGLLCIMPQGLKRAAPLESGGTPGPNCDGAFNIDMNAFNTVNWTSTGCSPAPGQTNPAGFLGVPGNFVQAQMWGRDSVSTGQSVSDGIAWIQGP